MSLRIATWNINSVRLRIDQVRRFLRDAEPDILCLQEIKCRNDTFPEKAFRSMGYSHIAVNGQAGYHGVATVSRRPFAQTMSQDFCGKGDARHIAVRLDNGPEHLLIHNFYVPAGGDVPDPQSNEKFAHKLQFLNEMADWFETPGGGAKAPCIMVGDINIAPLENDVWSHRQLIRIVSHTPVEVDHLSRVQRSRDWVDVMRAHIPADQKLYTWWSYRARDWRAANKGRRLDHIWATPDLSGRFSALEVIEKARGWTRPSDHCPVIATLDW